MANGGQSNYDNQYAIAMLILGVILILASAFGPNWHGPADWLTGYTTWAAKFVALVISAHKVWKLADVFIAKLA